MGDSFSDKRRSVRTRRLRHALCVFNNGASSLDVTLRDLSTDGARVVGDGLAFLPRPFDFRVREGDRILSGSLCSAISFAAPTGRRAVLACRLSNRVRESPANNEKGISPPDA